MMKKKMKKSKKTEQVELKEEVVKEEVVKEEIGEVLQLVADKDNPIGDGKEYKEDD